MGLGSGPGEAGGQIWAASGRVFERGPGTRGEWSGRLQEGSLRGVLLASVLHAARFLAAGLLRAVAARSHHDTLPFVEIVSQ